MWNCYYNLLLYNATATSATLLLYCFILNCWLILPSCCKTRRKMLVFDRLRLFPLTLALLYCSPLYNLPFHLIQLHMLSSLGLSLAEYARYSSLIFPPLKFCLIGRCSRCWSLGVQEQKVPGVFYDVEFPVDQE